MPLALCDIRHTVRYEYFKNINLFYFYSDSLRKWLDVGSTYRGSFVAGKTYVNSEHMISLSYCLCLFIIKTNHVHVVQQMLPEADSLPQHMTKTSVSNTPSLSVTLLQPTSLNQFKQLQSSIC